MNTLKGTVFDIVKPKYPALKFEHGLPLFGRDIIYVWAEGGKEYIVAPGSMPMLVEQGTYKKFVNFYYDSYDPDDVVAQATTLWEAIEHVDGDNSSLVFSPIVCEDIKAGDLRMALAAMEDYYG